MKIIRVNNCNDCKFIKCDFTKKRHSKYYCLKNCCSIFDEEINKKLICERELEHSYDDLTPVEIPNWCKLEDEMMKYFKSFWKDVGEINETYKGYSGKFQNELEISIRQACNFVESLEEILESIQEEEKEGK